MIKKAFVILMAMCMAGSLITGCQSSGSSNSSEGGTEKAAEQTTELNESDKNLAKIRDAYANYYASPVRGMKTVHEREYKSGWKSKQTTTTMIDTNRNIIFRKHKDKTSGSKYEEENRTDKYKEFYTKEDGKEYKYAYRRKIEKNDDGWDTILDESIWYKIELPEDDDDLSDETYTSYIAYDNSDFLVESEDVKYRNIVVSENGHKDIDGIDTIEYKVEYEVSYPNYEDTTREELIKDYEYDEDIIKKIEGMSEGIDAYVEYCNEQAAKAREFHSQSLAPIFLNAETGELVRALSTYDEDSEFNAEIENDFETYYNKYDRYKYLSEEQGEKEALEEVNSEDYDNQYNEDPSVKNTTKTTYYTGDACEEIPELPEKVTEMKWKEYYDGTYDWEY